MQTQAWKSCLCALSSLLILLLVCFVEVVVGEKCYRDDSLGDRDGNVYHCESKDLPRCCIENAEPTCCMSESDKNWKEQLQLWGTVAAVIVVLGILFVCCKNDVSFCNNESSLKERWDNFRHKKETKDSELVKDDQLKDQYYDNPIGGFGEQNSRYPDPYRYPPLPGSGKGQSFDPYTNPYA
ncbi:uncharacterized protein LOC101850982 [Aplysia californica]|uniref:Uncharacterized protein LOC101850982 n=1 Tax=Aplysia californica TaxID=6500 RepID=A0ABM0K0J2_APLCA|nr:uncharacterized protein LOC101850982 [Aplysia californica]